jgi:hypothetical protein
LSVPYRDGCQPQVLSDSQVVFGQDRLLLVISDVENLNLDFHKRNVFRVAGRYKPKIPIWEYFGKLRNITFCYNVWPLKHFP